MGDCGRPEQLLLDGPRPVSTLGTGVALSGADQHGLLWSAAATGVCITNMLEELKNYGFGCLHLIMCKAWFWF